MSTPTQDTQTPDVPAGYMRNAAGYLIPTEQVRESDLLRDETVRNLVIQAIGINKTLRSYKEAAINDIADLIAISAERYGAKIGGKAGNVQLHTYDGKYRIERVMAKLISFTEELQAAKALVEQCIIRWSDGARSELKALVMRAFKPNSKGELRTSAVLDLLRLEIDDDDWQNAMRALKDSIQVNGSTTYIRAYERIGMTDHYRLIALDLAGVMV
jgi:hypothetical protein